jgi:hypothetical protein
MTDPLSRATSLLQDLRADAARLDVLHEYYAGRSALPHVPRQASEELRRLVDLARTAWGALVVDAVAERLVVEGVNCTAGSQASAAAWALWQGSALDARQNAVHVDALVSGASYVLVWPAAAGGASVRGLDSRDTIGVRAGSGPWALAEAVHTWTAGGVELLAWYGPDEARTWARPAPRSHRAPALRVVRWWRDPVDSIDLAPSGAWVPVEAAAHTLGGCPVVRIANLPDLRGDGVSDLQAHLPAIDRITETVLGRLTAGKFGAYRQRWATGIRLPDTLDPDTGEPVLGPDGLPVPGPAPFRYGADLLWTAEDPAAEFGDFAATDLRPIVEAVEQDIKHLASVTRTPAHYLLGGSANPPSAEALLAAESGLAAKVRRRQLDLGEAWEQVVRLAARAADVPQVADDDQLEVVWRNTEVRSPGAVADAMLKLRQAGLPLAALLETFGWSPQAIDRVLALAAAEQAQAAAAQAAAYGA